MYMITRSAWSTRSKAFAKSKKIAKTPATSLPLAEQSSLLVYFDSREIGFLILSLKIV